MFTIDIKKDTVEFDGRLKKSAQEPVTNLFFIENKDDVLALTTPEMLEVHNAIARANPDLGVRETSRFSTRQVGEKRVWSLFVTLKAEKDHPTSVAAEAEKPPTKTKTVKPKKARVVKDGPKTWKDVTVKKANKQIEPRKGSAQEQALALVSREHGIKIDDWIEKMNETRKRGKWSHGNAWSGLVYLLNRIHGYGLRREGGRFYLDE